MFLHMVVHSILVLFDLRTDGTDKLARSILLIDVRHLYPSMQATALQFFLRRVRISPALLAVAIMTSTAVGFSRESFFLGVSTAGPMILFCRWDLFSGGGIDVERTELLSALPAPGAATAGS
jgi:hypothetical protein